MGRTAKCILATVLILGAGLAVVAGGSWAIDATEASKDAQLAVSMLFALVCGVPVGLGIFRVWHR